MDGDVDKGVEGGVVRGGRAVVAIGGGLDSEGHVIIKK